MIVFVHLLNDRSGSPRVLKSVIACTAQPCLLFIGSDGDGLLSDVACERRTYWYRRTGNRFITLVTFMLSQLALFVAMARARLPKDALIYVNTLLPFGAALFGKLTGRRVIYHVHEVSLSPRIFQRFLVSIARLTSTRLIYVSNAHRQLLPIASRKEIVIPNGIDPDLGIKAANTPYHHRHAGKFVVLMLATPMPYKGIGEFMRLAESLLHRSDIEFRFAPGRDGYTGELPANVRILPPTNDPSPYYASASLVLNLSRPDLWVETFGLTLLEAMAFGVPVIAPEIGGPAELITNGREGYLADCRHIGDLTLMIARVADDPALHKRLSDNARARAAGFAQNGFAKLINRAVAEAANADPRNPSRLVIGDYEVTM